MKTNERFVIGVDVGTGSARAGIFDASGTMLASATHPIAMWKPQPEHVEQSSEDIWRAVCAVTRSCREQASIAPENVAGISFDATCSLVVLDGDNRPLPVNAEGDAHRNIIVWMDHRALSETEEINKGDYEVLRYVGGRLSPEMETPKLLWLKRHLPQTWTQAAKFFDLADFLTWRASGVDASSLCTVVCKWTYLGHEARWDSKYFEAIGLDDLFDNNRVSSDVRPMGTPLGPLSSQAAEELGLSTDCIVGVGIIDAHAGGLGLLGAVWNDEADSAAHQSTLMADGRDLSKLETALALIGGTSNCHMAVSREPRYIDGIWGPYFGAMVPEMWLTEGGQSTAGSAIDHVIDSHPHAPALRQKAETENRTVYELLNEEIARLQRQSNRGPEITRDLHVLPYFLGNRSPNADPHARAIIDGLSLDASISSLALQYLATIQAVAYGTRDIIRAMNERGYAISTLFVTGGGTKNPLWLQEHADATGCTIVLPREPEAVLLGSAVLAATAAGLHADIYEAMAQMNHRGQVIEPRAETAAYHSAKFEVFRAMYREQKAHREMMKEF